jgi:hypothetical protein
MSMKLDEAEIGMRVLYQPSDKHAHRSPINGEIVKVTPSQHFPGLADLEGYVTVKVDFIPAWWSFENTDLFCPSLDSLTPEPRI